MYRRDAGLDAVRACAIWLVMVSHGVTDLPTVAPTNLDPITFGTATVGVEIFFGLSGFLIGNILLEIQAAGFSVTTVGRFLARRWLRTLPLYYVFLLFTVWMWPANRQTMPAFFFMVQSPFAVAPEPNDFPQSWSLPIEEFSYILLPLLAFLLRRTRRPVLYASLAMLVLSLAIRALFTSGTEFGDVRVGTVWRLDAITYGVLAAIIVRQAPRLLSRYRWAIVVTAVALMATHAVLFAFQSYLDNAYGRVFALPVFAAAFAALLPMLRSPIVMSFGVTKLMQVTSRLAYSLYIVHLAMAATTHVLFPGWPIPAKIAAYVVMSYGVAMLLNVIVERPFMALRPASLPGTRRDDSSWAAGLSVADIRTADKSVEA